MRHRTIRFRDVIEQEVEAFAGRHKLKDQDGNFDFSDCLHQLFMELLQKARDYDQAASDVQTWKNYAGVQEQTTKTYCQPMDLQVTPIECQVCAEKRLQPKCPKAKPMEKTQP